jgi:non-ribosomal peptide synthetase component F
LTYRGSRLRFDLSNAKAIKGIATQEKTTLYTVLLAGFMAVLNRLTGQDDLIVGSPMACRGQSEVEKVVGYFINAVAMRASIDPKMSFKLLMDQVRQTIIEAMAHQYA